MEASSESHGITSSKWNFYNVIMLGLSFMFVFTAFQTSSMIEQLVLEDADHSHFRGSGYTSLCIIYGVFAAANWISPSVVAIFGPKISLMLGALTYFLFVLSFLKPMVWALYSGSVLIGVGAAVIWTAQGTFLTLNSSSDTIGRNSGIFWALFQSSLFFGNLFVFFVFKHQNEHNDSETITDSTRKTIYIVLSSVCGLGVLLMLLLRSAPKSSTYMNVNTANESKRDGPLAAFVNSIKLFATKEMGLLAIVFAYTGLELTFFSGVYGTCLGHTLHFSDSTSLTGISGVCIGLGEIAGGLSFGILGKKTNKYGRDPIVFFGFLVHTIAFYLIFLNLPPKSPYEKTSGDTYINPQEYIAFICAFLLGLGDSSYNTQIYSLLGHYYSENSAPAFALYKFVQSAACAAAFFYSQTKLSLSLPLHLLILVVTNAMAAIAFFMVERSTSQRQRDGYARVVTHGSEEDVRSDVTDKQQQVPPQGSAGYTSFDSKGHDEDEGEGPHEDKGQGDELVAPGGGVENHAVTDC